MLTLMRGRRVGVFVGLILVWWAVAFGTRALALLDGPFRFAAVLPLVPSGWSTLLVGPAVAGAAVGVVAWRTGRRWVYVSGLVVASSILVGLVGWRWFDRGVPEGYLTDGRVVGAGFGLYAAGCVVGLVLALLAARRLPSVVAPLVVLAWWVGPPVVEVVGRVLRLQEPSGLVRDPSVLGWPLSRLLTLVALVAAGVLAGRVGAWVWAGVGAALVLAAQVAVVSIDNVSILIRPPAVYDVAQEALDRITGILPAFLQMRYPWEPLVALAVGVAVGALWRGAAQRPSPDDESSPRPEPSSPVPAVGTGDEVSGR